LFHSFPAIALVLGVVVQVSALFSAEELGAEFSFVEPAKQKNYFVPLFGDLNDFAGWNMGPTYLVTRHICECNNIEARPTPSFLKPRYNYPPPAYTPLIRNSHPKD
jgi:hypothetical protein